MYNGTLVTYTIRSLPTSALVFWLANILKATLVGGFNKEGPFPGIVEFHEAPSTGLHGRAWSWLYLSLATIWSCSVPGRGLELAGEGESEKWARWCSVRGDTETWDTETRHRKFGWALRWSRQYGEGTGVWAACQYMCNVYPCKYMCNWVISFVCSQPTPQW